jgi:diguanylate cyclase (GGDEF)-like protein/PAS domain S-box-containing protein
MNPTAFEGLIHSAALLIATAFVYDQLTIHYRNRQNLSQKLLIGFLLGVLGMILMLAPWRYVPGIIFDTRSVVISVAGLYFGLIPTTVAILMTCALRFFQGGAATLTGISVIITSGMLGIAWRHFRGSDRGEFSVSELYIFGLLVHGVMLALMFTLPSVTAWEVLGVIGLPVIIIYPFATMFFGLLVNFRHRREKVSRKLQESEQRLRLALEASYQGIYDFNIETGAIIISDEYARMLEYEPDEYQITFGSWVTQLHPDDREQTLMAYNEYISGHREVYSQEFRMRTRSGDWKWIYSTGKVVERDKKGHPLRMLGIHKDISERKKNAARLEYLATHDTLTGLANRVLLCDRLEQSILFAQRSQRLVAVLLIDLDRFKVINDCLGHGSGDEILKKVAMRLRETVREVDTVARFGGDEFVILLTEVADTMDVAAIAEKILCNLSQPYLLDGLEHTITGSLGISIYPSDGVNSANLIRHADIAMYRAKEETNRFCFYAPGMGLHSRENLELEADLRRALERGELLVYYQPKVNMATGKIIGSEALLRWQHPEKGMISPSRFIPLAEETGMILPIGEWVLMEVCRQVEVWQRQDFAPLPVAVNLSARQFRKIDLVDSVQRVLAETGTKPGLLELELTESMVMHDPGAAVVTMQQLKNLGVKLALDDFGTGYSSLNYLRRFPVDCLKIDRSFIRDVPGDPSAAAVAASIVDIAQRLGLNSIAEGVETREQLDFLVECGCGGFQGFLFSAPVSGEDFAAVLRSAQSIKSNKIGHQKET